MDKVLRYTLREEDLEPTAGGLVNLILRDYIGVTGHEISRAKYTPGGIMADGRQVRVSDRIPAGTELVVTLPEDPGASERITPVQAPPELPLEILYEDEDLLIVNKPAGVVVHPSPGHHLDTMANYVAGYYAARGVQAACRITGRLDKETSGVLVYALNRASAARLTNERARGTMKRTYVALVEGTFPVDAQEGVITGNIDAIPGVLMKRQVTEDGSGRTAVTHYKVLGEGRLYGTALSCTNAETSNGQSDGAPRDRACAVIQPEMGLPVSLVEFQIDTGRTHQIRLHMAENGHPLLGDNIYGTNAPAPRARLERADGPNGWIARREREMAARQSAAESPVLQERRAMLHAIRMELIQPFTGEPITVTAPLPEDFCGMMQRAEISYVQND